jgi:hypothetical protein
MITLSIFNSLEWGFLAFSGLYQLLKTLSAIWARINHVNAQIYLENLLQTVLVFAELY